MNSEVVATYYYDHHSNNANSVFEVVACYESLNDYDKRKVSFYDIYDKTGVCVNEGNSFDSFPTWDFVRTLYRKGI